MSAAVCFLANLECPDVQHVYLRTRLNQRVGCTRLLKGLFAAMCLKTGLLSSPVRWSAAWQPKAPAALDTDAHPSRPFLQSGWRDSTPRSAASARPASWSRPTACCAARTSAASLQHPTTSRYMSATTDSVQVLGPFEWS